MNRSLTILTSLLFTFIPLNVSALTMDQFNQICQSTSGKCSNNVTLQAYVGGALDLLATLNEQTEYLGKLYCKQPEELFNVPTIIDFMQAQSQEYANRNAMLLVVHYFEQNGGCNENK